MKKIQRTQTRDHITQMLRYEILSGNIKAGEELAQKVLRSSSVFHECRFEKRYSHSNRKVFLIRLPNRHMQVAHLEADRVSHIFRVIAAMAAEMFSLIPSEVGDALLIRAQALAVAEDKSCELECHAMLISYVNNRYLEKVYQQFLDGYVSYVILHLKKDNQESAQLFAELADVIRQGRRDEIGQVMQRYFLSLAEIMRQHMKDWESAEA